MTFAGTSSCDDADGASKTVFVGNLSWATGREQLRAFLAPAGPIVSVEVQHFEDTNRSKGWGLAVFDSHVSAVRAVALLNGTELQGRQLHLRLDRSNVNNYTDGTTSVYVGNIAWTVDDSHLTNLFAAFEPLSCNVLTNMYGRSRGFGIVKFSDPAAANSSIATLNGVEFHGRLLECRLDRGPVKSEDHFDRTAVFVGKLGPEVMSDSDLEQLFSSNGPIVSAKLQKAGKGKSKGWGVVKFYSTADAKNAVDSINASKSVGSAGSYEVRFDRK